MSEVIYISLKDDYMPVPTKEDWLKIATEYSDYRQIPNCLGSIDGKHIRLQKPSKTASQHYNYKNFFSLHLFASVDANYTFTCIDVGAVGSANDNAVFRNSSFGKCFFRNQLNIPAADYFPFGSEKMPFFFIADEAFPICSNLMRPYPGKNIRKDLSQHTRKETFNYRLSRARMNVECGFGIYRSKFRIFDTPIKTNLETSKKIVKATCVLHNFIRREDRPHVNETEVATEFRESRMTRKNLQDLNVRQLGCGGGKTDGQYVRDKLSEYFLSEAGTVPWQSRRINPTNFQ